MKLLRDVANAVMDASNPWENAVRPRGNAVRVVAKVYWSAAVSNQY